MKISVAAIAINDKKLLIAQRLPKGDMGGKWEFPGGKVEGGESFQDALKREFKEEFAVDIRIGAFLGESSFHHKGVKRSLMAYRVYIDSFDFVLTEHSVWRWADIEELKNLDFTPSDLSLLPFIAPVLMDNAHAETAAGTTGGAPE